MAQTFTIRCRASGCHSLAIVNGEVVLAVANPLDDRQLWHKDVLYSTGLKDEAGHPAFALVNKSTGDALKHSFGHCSPVRAIKFAPGYLDESILWAESEDLGDGYRRIHMINNSDYIFDAERAIPQSGGAIDGTRLILHRGNGGLNQLWRIAPHGTAPEHATPVRVVCQSNQSLSVTVRDGAVVLAHADRNDENQQWMMSYQNTGRVTDKEGHRSFVLVNKSTGKALKHSRDCEPVGLAGHSPDSVDVALLWTQSDDLGKGFHGIRIVSDVGLVLDAAEAGAESDGGHHGTRIIVFPSNGGLNQKWKMIPLL